MLRHALTLLTAAEAGLARFGDEKFGFAEASAEWGSWRGAVTALPVFEDDGRVLVHLGMGTLKRGVAAEPVEGPGAGAVA